MRDHEADAALEDVFHALLDAQLGFRIHRRCGLVHDEDLRLRQDRPGERDELFLARREAIATLAHLRLVALLHAHDEVVRAGEPGAPFHFLVACAEPPVADVVEDGAAEDVGVLQHHAKTRLQPVQAAVAVVDAVHQHLPRGRFVEAADDVHQGALAAAGRADDGDGFVHADLQVDVPQHGLLRVVGERDVHEFDLGDALGPAVGRHLAAQRRGSLHGQRALHARRVRDFRLGLDQRQHALGGRLRHLHFREPMAHDVYRLEEGARQREEGDQRAGADGADVEQRPADAERQVRGDGGERQHQRQEDRGEHQIAHRGAVHRAGEAGELAGVGVFADEGLAGRHAHDRLVVGPGDARVGAAHKAGGREDALLELGRQPADDGHDGHRHERELPMHDEHGGGDADHHRRAPDQVQKRPGEDVGELPAVRRQARHQPADRAVVEIGEGQPLQVRERVAADVVACKGVDLARHPDEDRAP